MLTFNSKCRKKLNKPTFIYHIQPKLCTRYTLCVFYKYNHILNVMVCWKCKYCYYLGEKKKKKKGPRKNMFVSAFCC